MQKTQEKRRHEGTCIYNSKMIVFSGCVEKICDA